MGLHKDYDETQAYFDYQPEDLRSSKHKKEVHQRLEDRLELKRLKDELEYFDGELDGEFDWDYLDKERDRK